MVDVLSGSPRSRGGSGKRRKFTRRVAAVCFVITGIVQILRAKDDITYSHLIALMDGSITSSSSASSLWNTSISRERHDHVCGNKKKNKYGLEWELLCDGELVMSSEKLLQEGQDVHLVQIGAHVGFEDNDPFARGISSYLNSLTPDEKKRVHWHFVEPSPPNYQRLMMNLANHSALCDMRGIHKAVVPDDLNSTQKEALTFYSISRDIDPETGYDSRSGKSLPKFVTQISSFSMEPLIFNKQVFSEQGLQLKDYIVETKVPTISYSELIGEIMGRTAANKASNKNAESRSGAVSLFTSSSSEKTKAFGKPLFVLIDTEGLDCSILGGISETSPFWPPFLIYERTHCTNYMKKKTRQRLKELGYTAKKIPRGQNIVAIRNSSYT